MAKKNDKSNNIFDYELENEKEKKKKKQKSKKKPSKKNQSEKFNFDNEIVIGVSYNPKSLQKEEKSKPKQKLNQKTNVKKDIKSKQNLKTKSSNVKPTKRTPNKKIQTKKVSNNKEVETKKVNVKKIVLLILLFVFIIGLICVFTMTPLFNIKEIEITNNSKVTTHEIEENLEFNLDDNLFIINKYGSIKNIKNNPYVESVEIKRVWPDKIKISIKERTPRFIMFYGEEYYLINTQGYVLEKISDLSLYDFKTVSGFVTEDIKPGIRLNEKDLNFLENTFKIIEIMKSNNIEGYVNKITINAEFQYVLTIQNGLKTVYLGDISNLNTRILFLKSIIEDNLNLNGEIFIDGDLINDKPFFREKI